MQEIWVLFLGSEDPLEKEMATHSRILAWKISWTEGCSPWGCKESGTTEQSTLPFVVAESLHVLSGGRKSACNWQSGLCQTHKQRDEYTDGHKSTFSEVKGKSPYAWVGCSFIQENWFSKKSVWLRKLPAFSTPVYLIR